MKCNLCGSMDAQIRECELSVARYSLRAHVDCNGHSEYRAISPEDIAETNQLRGRRKTMSKHTPGPWYADKEGYIYRRPLRELYEYGGGIAGDKPLAAAWQGWYGEGQTGYPVEANARLIAAAPEMYELLEYIRDTATIETATHVLERVNTLLAKIEGGGE